MKMCVIQRGCVSKGLGVRSGRCVVSRICMLMMT